MDDILAQARRLVDDVEIYSVKGKEFPVLFKANSFYTAEKKDFEGIGIRVINRGKLGFAHTTSKAACGAIIEYAKNSAKFGESAKFVFPAKIRRKPIQTFFESTRNIETEEVKQKSVNIINEILKKEPDAKVDVQFNRSEETVRIMNTKGLDITYKKSSLSIFVQIFLIIDGSFTWFYKIKTSPKKTFLTKTELRELLKNVKFARNVVPVRSEKMSVIIMPMVMSTLLRSLAMGVNGKHLQKGSSPLKGKENKKILGSNVTIYDDALLKDGFESRPFDGEGIASRRIPLFKNGVLENFLFDLQTAGILGKKSTGSAVRGFSSMPSPGTSNIVVNPGNWSLSDMIKDVKNGIIVYSVLGAGQSNLLAGDFSCNISLGFKIKNGRIEGRVKNTMIAGNVYDAMRNIEGIGKKVENIESFYTSPFYFKSLNVVSK